jgi:DNA repair protein RecO (recombination protein O)
MSRSRLYRVVGVIIRQRNLGEADRVVVLLTQERGKLSSVARGVRRARSKLAGSLQLFCHGRFLLAAGRSLDVITQVQLTDSFPHLVQDIGRLSHASYVCELVDVLTEEGAPDDLIYDLVVATLRALDEGGHPATAVRVFELKLLTHLGYGPEAHTCVSCSAEVEGGEAGFSAQEGGVLCHRCRQAQRVPAIPAGVLRAMRDMIELPLENLAKRRLTAAVGQEMERIMRAYVDYRLDRPLKSAGLLTR